MLDLEDEGATIL